MKENKYPKRLSFHEIRSLLSEAGAERILDNLTNKDILTLHTGQHLLNQLLRKGTPYIIEECRMGFITKGAARLTINLVEHEVDEGTFAFIGTGSLLQIDKMTDDFDMSGIMISNERLKASLGQSMPTWCNNAVFFTIHPDKDDADMIRRTFDIIIDLVAKKRFPDQTLNGLIYSLAHYYDYLKKLETDMKQREVSRGKELFDTFIHLVNMHNRREHKIEFYADKMCVTPRYLGTTVKKTSGITAKEWIDRAITTNAKVMLKYSNRQICQIADELNFTNASFFCKYFKHATGMTPQEYRNG